MAGLYYETGPGNADTWHVSSFDIFEGGNEHIFITTS
jgi:hypothetical protein